MDPDEDKVKGNRSELSKVEMDDHTAHIRKTYRI